ncbi:DNA-processing protein DprA [Treponema sp.]|uniref:DNA-processing protein DprA n=1 Tax=Treponema sp. TaxID=166 RepID=UPI00298DA373|nr:DNA-processing protein DprA [Treponema sp.]MCQ2241306.1 DNA-protecting protein DprA [Treponema sp.]
MDIMDLALSHISFLTNREKKLLKKNIDSLDKLALLSIEDISSITGRKTRGEWNGFHVRAFAQKAELIMESKEIHGSVVGEYDFPAMLGTINDPPYCFFYRGNLDVLKKKCVSVVGTRRVCQDSAVAALEFSKDAVSDGQVVVSGLANGIDSFAHRGALQTGVEGGTVAVLPCGIDSVVPYGNRTLAASILKNGGLLCSEYIPGTPAEAWRFVQRNRLIAALSPATVVIHAPEGSGALITADFAITYNRDIVFHCAGFTNQAKDSGGGSERRSKKNAPSAERYVLEGAPVIENYADYVRVMASPPGTFSVKDRQLELF